MSRMSPVPTVHITRNTSIDDETNQPIESIIIDVAISEEVSNGFVVLDEPGDLFILRNAIDYYITNHNIKNPAL